MARKPVTATIGGVKRRLRLTLASFRELEEKTGKNFFNDDAWEAMDVNLLIAVIHAATAHEKDRPSEDDIAALDLVEATEIVHKLIGTTQQGAKEEQGAPLA